MPMRFNDIQPAVGGRPKRKLTRSERLQAGYPAWQKEQQNRPWKHEDAQALIKNTPVGAQYGEKPKKQSTWDKWKAGRSAEAKEKAAMEKRLSTYEKKQQESIRKTEIRKMMAAGGRTAYATRALKKEWGAVGTRMKRSFKPRYAKSGLAQGFDTFNDEEGLYFAGLDEI